VSGQLDLLPWQHPLWARIAAMEEGGRLPHALLLTGAPGLGKERLALRLAACSGCAAEAPGERPCGTCDSCRQAIAGSHPDIVRVAPEPDRRTIGVEAVRALIEVNSLTAARAALKAAILVPAEALTLSAANTLLKTLEEPAGGSLFLLVTSRPSALPATVRSRCQRLESHPPPRDQALAWLRAEAEEADEERLACALAEARGAPLRALERLRSGAVGQVGRVASELLELLTGGEADPLACAGRWRELAGEELGEVLVEAVQELVRLRHGLAARIASPNPAMQSAASGLDFDALYRLLDRAMALRGELTAHQGLNAGLLIEGFACTVRALAGERR